MIKLYLASVFATILAMVWVGIFLYTVTEYGTFLYSFYTFPLLIWASVIKFRVNHTVIVK
jgi:hypothetical protein